MNSSKPCVPAADDAFGPQVQYCRDGFDFTLFFEQVIFTIVPVTILLVASPFRILHLLRQPVVLSGRSMIKFQVAKSIIILGLFGLQLALVVLWAKSPRGAPRAAIASASFSLVASLILLPLSVFEHVRSLQPSPLISTYLLFSALLDIPQARTLFLQWHADLGNLFLASLILKAIILVLEQKGKRSLLMAPYKSYPPEALSGIISRSFFWWLNSLFAKGHRQLLNFGDLYETDPELSSTLLHNKMVEIWKRYCHRKGKNSLVLACVVCFKRPLLATVFPRLCVIGFKFCQPLLIKRAISLLGEPRSVETKNIGRLLIGATALIYLGLGIMTARYRHMIYRTITMVRGGLICLIFDATLHLDGVTAGESAAVTLMSTDIERIAQGIELSDNIWAAPIEIGIAVFLLQRQLGLACLAPTVIAVVCTFGALQVGKLAIKTQKVWLESVQTRVAATASTLSSIKGVKMMGLTNHISDDLQSRRVSELKKYKSYRIVTTVQNIVSNFSLMMSPSITFLLYVIISRSRSNLELDPATAFTALSLISLLSIPMQNFATALPSFAASLSCYTRIQEFLAAGGQHDRKNTEEFSVQDHLSSHEPHLISIELEVANPHTSSAVKLGDIIRVNDASFSFPSTTSPILRNISVRITSDTLTLVTGPTGSGKTAFLEALLGELCRTKGNVTLNATGIGYCAQNPWLPNATIRDIILASNEYDDEWYRKTLHVCMLDQDLERLPDEDKTVVGSKGTKLSGGQKQRVALARAIYSKRKLLLLDDIFSGLDASTEHILATRVLGTDGICAKHHVTVVLATHSSRLLKLADSVIFIREGKAVQQHKDTTQAEILMEHTLQSTSSSGPATESNRHAESDAQGTELNVRDTLVDGQDLSRRTGDTRVYAYYAKAVGWRLSLAFFSSHAIVIFSMKFPDIWLKWWSEAEVAHPGQRTWLYVGVNIGLATFAMLCVIVMLLILFIFVVPQASSRIHKRLLDTVMAAPYSFFACTAAGVTLNRFSQDMTLIDTQLPGAIMQTSDGALTCVAELILIAIVSKYMAILAPFLMVLLYFLQKFYLHTSRQIRFLDLEAKSPLYSNFLEIQNGVVTIRAFGWQKVWRQRNIKLLDESQRPFYLLYCIQRWLNLVLDLVIAAFAVAIMTLATQLNQSVSGGSLGVALVNILSFSSNLAYLITAWTQLETSIGAIARVRTFELSTPSEVPVKDMHDPPSDWPHKGAVEFSNVSAGYSTTEPILRDLSLQIQPGQKIGICGRTGSGKSSMLLTVLQMMHVTAGSITIDGVNLSSMVPQKVRSSLITIPQDAAPLPGTVRFNSNPSHAPLTDNNIEAALKEVGLLPLIQSRGGLQAEMSSLRLSYGQQQLFALARAILILQNRQRQYQHNNKESSTVLLMDEVTANVDAATEARMMEILNGEAFRGITVLAIAHRLNTIVAMDQIVVLQNGQVVESGKPAELIEAKGSMFKAMFEQMK